MTKNNQKIFEGLVKMVYNKGKSVSETDDIIREFLGDRRNGLWRQIFY